VSRSVYYIELELFLLTF